MIDQTLQNLMKEHEKLVQRICVNYEKDVERARDLYQEIWFQIWKSLEHFKKDCSYKTWIYRIAHNTGISHAVKESRKQEWLSLEDYDEQTQGTLLEELIINKDLLFSLKEIIFTLKPLDRELFLLYLDGNGQQEIGEITGLSATNISTKISRIKKLIEKLMKKNGVTHE